jgi:O-antigen/teichoic acid export membrane protein
MTVLRPHASGEAEAPADTGFGPALVLMAGRVLASAVTFLIPVVLARAFDQHLFGDYKRLFLVYATLWSLGQVGMAESLYYFLPHHPDKAGRLLMNAAAMLAASGAAVAIVLGIAAGPVAAFLGNPEVAPYVPLLGAYLSIMLVTSVLEVAMVSRRRFTWAAATYVGTDILRAVTLVVPVVAGFGLRGLLMGAIASAVMRLLAVVWYLRKEFPADLRPDGPLLRAQLAYALPFALAMAVEIAQSSFHQYFVSYRVDAATFALYAVGCLQIPIVDFLAGPACNLMMVRIGEGRRLGDSGRVVAAFEDTTRKLALFFFPLFGFMLVAATDLIVLLYTPQYAASGAIFRLWCVAVLIAVFQTDGAVRALAQTRLLLVLNVIRLVFIAVLIGPMLSAFGLFGPVLVTLIASAGAKVVMLLRWKTHVGVPLGELLPWGGLVRIAVAAAFASFASATALATLPQPMLTRLAAASMVHAAVYVALLLGLGALTTGERHALTFRRAA